MGEKLQRIGIIKARRDFLGKTLLSFAEYVCFSKIFRRHQMMQMPSYCERMMDELRETAMSYRFH